MNLAETLSQEKLWTEFYAGGPGSGRRPGVSSTSVNRYKNEYGHGPKGHASWAFSHKYSPGENDEVFKHNGPYGEAKEKAQDWGQSKGHFEIHLLT